MITVTIDSVDRTSLVVFNSLSKRDNLNQQVDNLIFKIRKYGSMTYSPSIGDEVVVTSGSDTVFGGVIVKVEERVKASKILEYKVTCNDYSQYLKRQLVTERYIDKTATYIISDIISNYTSGFTVTGVQANITIASMAFNRLTVAECIQKLADAMSYVWYVDYDKDIHFFSKNTEVAPFNITDTSSNYIYDSLIINDDLTQIRNSILVQGGEQESEDIRTEEFSGDGSKDNFALANKYSSIPTVTVDSVAQTVGTEFLDDEALYDCMWNYNEKYVRFTTGNIPGVGTNNVDISGKYVFPIVVRVPSPTSIAEYGLYEYAITDKSIESQQEAIDRATAELTAYQNEINEGSFTTYEDGLRSGQVITINSTQRNRSISVLIQRVYMKMRDPEGNKFEYDVTFATLKSIGIIEYLQRQLRDREIIVDDSDTLLNYYAFEDDISTTDSLGTPSTSSPPYKWSNDSGTTANKLIWNFGTWS